MKTPVLSLTLITLVSFLFLPLLSPVEAITLRSGDRVEIAAGETIAGSLFVSGTSIEIEGTVDGDLFCAGQNVRILGEVTGDILCAGQTITLSGVAGGDLRVAGQNVTVNGTVTKNMSALAQQIELTDSAQVQGETHFGAQNVIMAGTVAKDVLGGAQNLELAGRVGGNVKVGSEELTLTDNASVSGNLDYTSPKETSIQTGVVGGNVSFHKAEESPRNRIVRREAATTFMNARRIFSLFAYLILTAALIALFPVRMPAAVTVMRERVARTMGIGFLLLFFTPFVILLFIITIVGIPFAVILGMLYALAIFLARLMVGYIIGSLLIERFAPENKENKLWTVIVGILAMWIIIQIPIVGGIFSFLAILWGMGGLYYILRPQHAVVPAKKK